LTAGSRPAGHAVPSRRLAAVKRRMSRPARQPSIAVGASTRIVVCTTDATTISCALPAASGMVFRLSAATTSRGGGSERGSFWTHLGLGAAYSTCMLAWLLRVCLLAPIILQQLLCTHTRGVACVGTRPRARASDSAG
jgi:hypothetical protein